jgi:hypothetical protein
VATGNLRRSSVIVATIPKQPSPAFHRLLRCYYAANLRVNERAEKVVGYFEISTFA